MAPGAPGAPAPDPNVDRKAIRDMVVSKIADAFGHMLADGLYKAVDIEHVLSVVSNSMINNTWRLPGLDVHIYLQEVTTTMRKISGQLVKWPCCEMTKLLSALSQAADTSYHITTLKHDIIKLLTAVVQHFIKENEREFNDVWTPPRRDMKPLVLLRKGAELVLKEQQQKAAPARPSVPQSTATAFDILDHD